MVKLVWDEVVNDNYTTGISNAVLYPSGQPGVPWNGLISLDERPTLGIHATNHYDGSSYIREGRSESFSASISAYTYPEELPVEGRSKPYFNLSYQTRSGDSNSKIHLLYNCRITPSTKAYTSVNSNVDPLYFTWGLETKPILIPNVGVTAHLIIDISQAYDETMELIGETLYGSDDTDPTLPSPGDILEIFEETSILRIIDHGDGSWSAIGPDDMVGFTDATSFQITTPSAEYLSADTFNIWTL